MTCTPHSWFMPPCPPPTCPPSITTNACAHVPNNETPVAVFLRFPLWRLEEARSALIKSLTVHKGYTGRVAGIGRNIQCVEGGWPCCKGLAMLCFDSCEEAVRWKDSVPEIRQYDWLDGIDLLIVPIRCIPPCSYRFVHLLDLKVFDCPKFRGWMDGITQCIQGCGGWPAVIATGDKINVKGLWNPDFLVVHMWEDHCKWECCYRSDTYRCATDQACAFAEIKACVFDLEPLCWCDCDGGVCVHHSRCAVYPHLFTGGV